MLLDFNTDSDNEILIFIYFGFKYVVMSPDWYQSKYWFRSLCYYGNASCHIFLSCQNQHDAFACIISEIYKFSM